MYAPNIKEVFVKRDSWIKKLKKSFDPELLAELIKKRIDTPNLTGPYVSKDKGETPTDILCVYIKDDNNYKNKLTPAIGLLLYKMNNDLMQEDHDVLRGVFSIIKECDLKECNSLVFNWLKKKNSIFKSDELKWKITFREGLMAFAKIQDKSEDMEFWWSSIWAGVDNFWWSAAFLGLQVQNPVAAANQINMLIARQITNTPELLIGIWMSEASRTITETAIKNGLNANSGWAGYALNMLMETLDIDNKDILMSNLKRLQRTN